MYDFTSESVALLIIYVIIAIFILFFPLAFIYSMLFGWLHESKRMKKLIAREQKVAAVSGGDNIHTLSTPINMEKVTSAGLVTITAGGAGTTATAQSSSEITVK